MPRLLNLSNSQDVEGVAQLRFGVDGLLSSPAPAPNTPLQIRRSREKRRRDLAGLIPTAAGVVKAAKNGRIKSFLDVEAEPCIHSPKQALTVFGATFEDDRREHCIRDEIDFAVAHFGTSLLRAEVPGKLVLPGPTAATHLLNSKGFGHRPWKQLTRVYGVDDFSVLEQAFWTAADTKRLPFPFGEANELTILPTELAHVRDVSLLRQGLARDLNYEARYQGVEESVTNMVVRPPGTHHHSRLLTILLGDQIIASSRVTPGYSVWAGMIRLSVRDIVIAPRFQGRGLLPWIFAATVLAGRMFIHPDLIVHPVTRETEQLLVETWLPNERLVRHYQEEIPGLSETGRQYFENE